MKSTTVKHGRTAKQFTSPRNEESSGSGFSQPGATKQERSCTRAPLAKKARRRKKRKKKVQISQGRATRVDAEPTDQPPHFLQIPPLFPHTLHLFLLFPPHPSNKQILSSSTLTATTITTITKQGLFLSTNYQTSS